jgi:uncharacterized membrane protein
MGLSSWICQYYIDPIIYDTGYNPVNTITWAILLSIALLLLIRLFRRLDLMMDERLVLCTVPYILAGSSLRVVEDAELASPPTKYLLITPLIYLLVFLVTLAALLFARKAFGRDFYKCYAAIGLVWALLNLFLLLRLGMKNPWVPLAVLFLGSALTGALHLLSLRLPQLRFLKDRYNLAILYVHMLDASSTYLGVDWLGYSEKHVVPTFLIDLTGTAATMYPLKLIILLPTLSLIGSVLRDDPSLKNLAKLTLIILGLAPAVRNTLRLAMGI